jgi:hypothetical protein
MGIECPDGLFSGDGKAGMSLAGQDGILDFFVKGVYITDEKNRSFHKGDTILGLRASFSNSHARSHN